MSIVSFDIDGVVGNTYYDQPKLDHFFEWRGSIIDAGGYRHGISPGMIELVQRLYGDNTISKVMCFSSGMFIRNGEFWMKFLKQSLSRDSFRELKGKVQIFSRGKLSEQKKRLKPLVGENNLKHTIHIDDKPDFIFPGEESNVLISRESTDAHFLEREEQDDQPIWFIANQACYIGGMLFTAKEEAQKQSIPVSKALFQLQFKEKSEGIFHSNYVELVATESYYRRGKAELQKVNQDFDFVKHGPPVIPEDDALIKRLGGLCNGFVEHFQKKHYDNAFKIIDEMLDCVERKSGRWLPSSRLVCASVAPLLKQACTDKALSAIASPILSKILELPLDSYRDSCLELFLNSLPNEARPHYLIETVKTYWDEMQHPQGFAKLIELRNACEAQQNFAPIATAIEYICRSHIRKKHHTQLFDLVRTIPALGPKIQCLNCMGKATPNSLRKLDILFLLMHSHHAQKDHVQASQAFHEAIKTINDLQLQYCHEKFIYSQFRKALVSFIDEHHVEMEHILPHILQIRHRNLKAILHGHACTNIPAFHQLALESLTVNKHTQLYVLILGLSLVEQAIKNQNENPEEICKLLKFLLGRYHLISKRTAIEDDFFKDVNYKVPCIREFLCTLPPDINRAKMLANLAKLYWDKKEHALSLNLILEINKTPPHQLLDVLLFSLIYFQSCNPNPAFNYPEIIKSHFSGWPQKLAEVIFLGNVVSNPKMSYAFSALHLWDTSDHANAFEALLKLKDSVWDTPQELTSKLEYFVVSEFCNSPYIYLSSRLVKFVSGISNDTLKLKALKKLHTALKLNEQMYEERELNQQLIYGFWKSKQFQKAFPIFKRMAAASAYLYNIYLVNSFKSIFEQGVPLKYISDIFSIIHSIQDPGTLTDSMEQLIKSIDKTQSTILRQIFNIYMQENASSDVKWAIYTSLVTQYWKLEEYGNAFEVIQSMLALDTEKDPSFLFFSLSQDHLPDWVQTKLNVIKNQYD